MFSTLVTTSMTWKTLLMRECESSRKRAHFADQSRMADPSAVPNNTRDNFHLQSDMSPMESRLPMARGDLDVQQVRWRSSSEKSSAYLAASLRTPCFCFSCFITYLRRTLELCIISNGELWTQSVVCTCDPSTTWWSTFSSPNC
jgi:hypothetical protein